MEDSLWYFAYGSNMSREIFVARRGMRPLETRIGRLENHRLCFTLPIGPGERGVANVRAHATSHVWGVLYLITAAQADHLDRTEGVPRVYRRAAVEVRRDDTASVSAFTYQSSIQLAGRKPSARYLGLLLDGARQHRLPEDYIRALMALELARDERQVPQT